MRYIVGHDGDALVELVVPRDRDECIRLLLAEMDNPLTGVETRNVIGWVAGTRLYARRRTYPVDSSPRWEIPLQTQLSVDLIEESGETRLLCRFGMPASTAAFLFCLFGGALLIGGVLMIGPLVGFVPAGFERLAGTWRGIAVPFLMAFFGLALLGFCRWRARDERLWLMAFLRDTIDARRGGE